MASLASTPSSRHTGRITTPLPPVSPRLHAATPGSSLPTTPLMAPYNEAVSNLAALQLPRHPYSSDDVIQVVQKMVQLAVLAGLSDGGVAFMERALLKTTQLFSVMHGSETSVVLLEADETESRAAILCSAMEESSALWDTFCSTREELRYKADRSKAGMDIKQAMQEMEALQRHLGERGVQAAEKGVDTDTYTSIAEATAGLEAALQRSAQRQDRLVAELCVAREALSTRTNYLLSSPARSVLPPPSPPYDQGEQRYLVAPPPPPPPVEYYPTPPAERGYAAPDDAIWVAQPPADVTRPHPAY